MRVIIHNLYNNKRQELSGDSAVVEREMLRLFPFLRRPEGDHDVASLVNHLNAYQMFEVKLGDDQLAKSDPETRSNLHVVAALLGHRGSHESALRAAKFLAGGATRDPATFRKRLWQHGGDHEKAALAHYGLEISPKNLKALRAAISVGKMEKSAVEPIKDLKVEAGTPDALGVAQTIQRAAADEFVLPVDLGGKHSHGSMLARDDEKGETWLLKPGSGEQNPAAGESQEPASQSRREVAFWHAAKALGVEHYYPRAELLLINGKEYAALQMLPWSFKTLDKLKDEDRHAAQQVVAGYVQHGIAHIWGFVDAVFGNPDRHAQNLMYRGRDVVLIDHGSAFAGSDFSPGSDEASFVPYYLRAAAPDDFSSLDAHRKLDYMPRLSSETALDTVRDFVDGFDAAAPQVVSVLKRYGVDPQPVLDRAAQVKKYAETRPIDLAINTFWVDA